MKRTIGAMISLAFAAGCASYPVPSDKMASSEAAVRGAQEVGASNNPRAALHLKLAQEQVEKAKAAINDGDNKRAEYILMRAEADAELALSLARETAGQAEANQAVEQVRGLRQQGMQK